MSLSVRNGTARASDAPMTVRLRSALYTGPASYVIR